MSLFARLKHQVRTDDNINRAQVYSKRAIRALPTATLDYVIEKFPIIQWLPKYSPRWIVNDLVAGLTVGVLLV
jgi:sodium-independent sulfate anion transporter 11